MGPILKWGPWDAAHAWIWDCQKVIICILKRAWIRVIHITKADLNVQDSNTCQRNVSIEWGQERRNCIKEKKQSHKKTYFCFFLELGCKCCKNIKGDCKKNFPLPMRNDPRINQVTFPHKVWNCILFTKDCGPLSYFLKYIISNFVA